MDLAFFFFFLKNEDAFLTKHKFNIKYNVKQGQMYGNAYLHNTPFHILSVKSMIVKGNQKIVRKPKHLRGMFEMNCLFLSGDFKFQVSPKVLISCPRMQSFSRCIHFLKASRYADLGTVIRY